MKRLYPASRSSSSGWKGKAPILMETEIQASGPGSYVAMSKQQNELPAVVVSTEIKKKKRECQESLDSPVDLDPLTAACKVQTLLNLSEAGKEKLVSELFRTPEDPILALKINQAWVTHYGAGAVPAVLDEIAEFDVPNGVRRDEKSPGFLSHFKTAYELGTCKASVLGDHQIASCCAAVCSSICAFGCQCLY